MHVALVILDGWGIAPPEQTGRDAIAAAETPTLDRLRSIGAAGSLQTHGRSVGLPEGQMGNSEVGHLTIGAGRIVEQESARIETAIAADRLDEVDAIAGAFDHVAETGGQVHFAGLVSDGGVHAHERHLHALIEAAGERNVPAVTHAFTDGRDTDPHGGVGYLADLQSVVDRAGTGHVATVTGRYYAMDRDHNWERTRRAYDAIVHREAEWTASDAVTALEESYERDVTDEFVDPTVIDVEAEGRTGELEDGDAVIVFNFRADRARQLTRMLADHEPAAWGGDTDPPEVPVVTMTEYDAGFDLPVAFEPIEPEETLGSTVAADRETQLRIAESEKYPHVTYFLNGGREVEFDGEIRRIVESPDVPTYDLQPEMSAVELTDTAIEVIETESPTCTVLNYANADMVGHTGDFDAAVSAVAAVDEQLGRLATALEAMDVPLLVTADHGNADDMGTADHPHTAHTTNPVPVVYLDADGTDGGRTLRKDGTLTDVAPTLLSVLDIEVPPVMTGQPLFETERE